MVGTGACKQTECERTGKGTSSSSEQPVAWRVAATHSWPPRMAVVALHQRLRRKDGSRCMSPSQIYNSGISAFFMRAGPKEKQKGEEVITQQ